MTFQASDDRGHHFLDLLDEDSNPLEPSTSKDRPWLKYIGHSNLLCTRATRAIVNHTPIKEYRLRFFSRKDFICLCGEYSIKTKYHILYDCKRFNNYWNLRRNSIAHFILFLGFNGNVFSFSENII